MGNLQGNHHISKTIIASTSIEVEEEQSVMKMEDGDQGTVKYKETVPPPPPPEIASNWLPNQWAHPECYRSECQVNILSIRLYHAVSASIFSFLG